MLPSDNSVGAAEKQALGLAAAEPMLLKTSVSYAPGAVVSKTLAQSGKSTLTVFAFDAGQGLSEHSAPFDAFVLVLDGRATLTIGGQEVTAQEGELVKMPASVPHSLRAAVPFKMLLIMLRN